jgi:hypothetical protein
MGAEKMTLDELHIGDSGVIATVGGEGALRRRLLDMGLTPKTRVTVRKMAPMGDPIELHLRGYELTIRAEDARKIEIVSDKTVSTKEPASRPPHAAGRGRRHGHREKNGIQANWQKDGTAWPEEGK